MSFLRTTPLPRLLAICVVVVVLAVAGVAIATAGSKGPVPPAKALATALRDASNTPAFDGLSARIRFTNHLVDSSSIQGSDPLLSGATGRLWVGADHHFRVELQSDAGDAQIVSDGSKITIYDAAMHLAFETTLPKEAAGSKSHEAPLTIATIEHDLARLMQHADVSGAIPDNVAGQPAYRVELAPKHDGGLLGRIKLAWDATHGVPLRLAIYARGDRDPVLELVATELSFGSVPASTFDVKPPRDTKITTLTPPGGSRGGPESGNARPKPITGPAAVGKAVPFTLSAPGSLAGIPRKDVRLIDVKGHPGALVTYGAGLGGIAVFEQAADASGAAAASGRRHDDGSRLSLPTVSINGVTGHELDTALGTMVRFRRAGVDYIVLGSVPPAAAETAAREL